MEDEGREGSERQVVEAAKKMMMARSGSKNAGAAAPVRGRRHGRRWSSSTDLDIIETASAAAAVTTTHTPTAAAAVLGRSYSTSAAIAVAVDVDGGVKQQQQQAAPEGEGEEAGEQRPRRRCGAGARLSRKIKEHRARFYIIRRCVAMLVCWRDADE